MLGDGGARGWGRCPRDGRGGRARDPPRIPSVLPALAGAGGGPRVGSRGRIVPTSRWGPAPRDRDTGGGEGAGSRGSPPLCCAPPGPRAGAGGAPACPWPWEPPRGRSPWPQRDGSGAPEASPRLLGGLGGVNGTAARGVVIHLPPRAPPEQLPPGPRGDAASGPAPGRGFSSLPRRKAHPGSSSGNFSGFAAPRSASAGTWLASLGGAPAVFGASGADGGPISMGRGWGGSRTWVQQPRGSWLGLSGAEGAAGTGHGFLPPAPHPLPAAILLGLIGIQAAVPAQKQCP